MILDNPCNPDWRVLKEARSLAEAGLAIRILAWDRTGLLPKEEEINGVRISRIRAPSRHRGPLGRLATACGYWIHVTKTALAESFDAVHSHDLPDLPVGVFLSLWKHRPLVYDAHELYWMGTFAPRPRLIAVLERLGERVLMTRAQYVITASEHLASYFRTVHPRVKVVGNWYDPMVVDRDSGQQLRHELGIPPDAFCLVYAGSLGPERNHQLLIDYAAAYPDTAVVVAGKGGVSEATFRSAAERLPNLWFLGWRTDPSHVYGLADALYYALREESQYRSISSPNNLFISIATGIPLVTTAAGDAGSIIAETGAGELLRPATVAGLRRAVIELCDPMAKAAILDRLSSLRARYTWKIAAAPLLDIYANLLDSTSESK